MIARARRGVVAVVLAGVAAPAAADRAAAEVAYRQAVALRDGGNFAEACPLFETSWNADPQLGVLLNLADCHEHVGKTATAWAEFRDAVDRARKSGDARADYAQRRADALTPRLATLHVVVPEPRVAGLVVRRDDADITALLAASLPIDPGQHTITASAPGYASWSATITIADEPRTTELPVPPLAKAEAPRPVPSEPTRATSSARHTRHVVGLSVGLGGVAIAVLGGVLGVQAASQWNNAKAACGGSIDACPASGFGQASSDVSGAQGTALASTITLAVGGAAVAAGAILYLTAPRDPEAARAVVRIAPAITRDSAGLLVIGRF